MTDPDLATGELYMEGRLRPINCDIYDVLEVLMANVADGPPPLVMRLNYRFHYGVRRLMQNNTALRSQRNVAHHYDLNGQLYDLFLDRDRHYSCAYFARGDETLEEAQAAKMRHIAAKLRLDSPGLRVLDIGSGWGGMALHLARHHRARVTGITLSTEQLRVARDRAAAAGLGDRVSFELADYRTMTGQFDRIVSIGMFEHVGIPHYDAYFQTIRRLLTPDGVALVHSIGGSLPPMRRASLAEQIHLPRRVLARAQRGVSGDREIRSGRDRCRDFADALRAIPCASGVSVSRATGEK